MDSEQKQRKIALRAEMRQTLSELSDEQKVSSSNSLCESIVQYTERHPAIRVIATFAALPFEPDLSRLHQLLLDHILVYPKSDSDGSMQFYRVDAASNLEVGLYNIPEPVANPAKLIAPEEIDLFLCPAFSYTPEGKRLGKGGGYYDRLLTNRREDSSLLGIIFKEQLRSEIPTEQHDISVDSVLSA